MSLIEIKTATITEKGQIVIPKEIRNCEGFETGCKVAVLAFDDHVELRPMKQIRVSEKISAAVASERVLAKDWDSKEDDEAWKDL